MKTNTTWTYRRISSLILLLIASVFLWAIVMPDDSPGSVSYSTARDIVRHGCAATIDDSAQKFRQIPRYCMASRLKRACVIATLAANIFLIWTSLSATFQTKKRQQKVQLFAGWARQLLNDHLIFHRRPPPLLTA